jgi:release factor glutamine methyltransferase
MSETYGGLLKTGIRLLEKEGIEDARIDAERLLLEAAGKSRSFLFVHRDDPCDSGCALRFFRFLERRCRREPLQYITGSQEFMGLPFHVDRAVLIPRQDTETLVEKAIEEAAGLGPDLRILDMCCGSGAIAVSCAHYLPEAQVTACDISERALEIAEKNAEANGTEGRISFF